MSDLQILLRLRARLLVRPRQSRRGGTGKRVGAAMLVRIGVLVLVGIGLTSSLSRMLSEDVSGPLGRALLTPLLAWVSSAATLLLFLVAVPVVLAAFTYSSDLKLLLLTPVSPRLILGEKFLSLYGGMTALVLVVGAIVLLSAGYALSLGVAYDLVAILALLLLPIVPLSLAILLTVAVLRWVPPARARAITAVFSALIGVVVYLGLQISNRRAVGRGGDPGQVFSTPGHAWWTSLPSSWPGRAVAAAGLGETGTTLAYLIPTILLALCLAGLAILLSAHLFRTGWATYQEVGRRSRLIPPAEMTAAPGNHGTGRALGRPPGFPAAAAPAIRQAPAVELASMLPSRAVWRVLIAKEWKMLRRDTQVWSRLIYPLFVMGFAVYNAVSHTGSGPGGVVSGATSLITVGFLTYFLLMVLALPIINREGRSLYLLALAPVSARDILLAKWAFCALPVLALVETVLILGTLFLHVAAGAAVLVAAAFACLVVAMAGGLLLVSLIWPRLDWDNPRRQTSGTATLASAIGGLILVGGTEVLIVLSQVWQTSRPLASAAAAGTIFVLMALIAAAVIAAAPPRLAALLAGVR